MIPVYVLDTSAWYKRYVQESGSERLDEIFAKAAVGEAEICMLPIVYYELQMRLQRARNAYRNRSSPTLPALRMPIAVIDQEIQNDAALCKLISDYIPALPESLHLFRIDERVENLMRNHPVGANDAIILICLEELATQLQLELRPLYFVTADEDLAEAAKSIGWLFVEFLQP